MKRRPVLAVILFLIWAFFMFVMHLVCFDVFEENNWYCYPVALGAFALQLLAINLIPRVTGYRSCCLVFGILYTIAVLWPGTFWLVLLIFDNDFVPLLVFCFCLNIVGAVSCLVLRFDYLFCKCPHCGKYLGGKAGRFCRFCGKKMDAPREKLQG